MLNIVLYVCFFEIICIIFLGKGYDLLDDKKNMNILYIMYILKLKLLKKYIFLYLNIICIFI